MDPDDFMKIVMSKAEEFRLAIQTGAQWEIAAQNAIADALRNRGYAIAREVKYPGTQQSVDLAFQADGRLYLVELKVESAQRATLFAGLPLRRAFNEDKDKLAGFDVDGYLRGTGLAKGRKWVVVIAYSGDAKRQMLESGLFSRLYDSGAIRGGIADA